RHAGSGAGAGISLRPAGGAPAPRRGGASGRVRNDPLGLARRGLDAARAVDAGGPAPDRRVARAQAGGLPRAHRGRAPPRHRAALPPRLGGRLPRPLELPDRAPALAKPRHQQQHLLREPRRGPPPRRGRSAARPRTPLRALPRGRGADHAGRALGAALPPRRLRRAPPARARLRAASAAPVARRGGVARVVMVAAALAPVLALLDEHPPRP